MMGSSLRWGVNVAHQCERQSSLASYHVPLTARRTRRQMRPRLPLNCARLRSRGDSHDERVRNGLRNHSEVKFEEPSFRSMGCDKQGVENVQSRGLCENGGSSSRLASPSTLCSALPMVVYSLIAEGTGYSQASYYTSLGLFVISVPGIWSLVKRSTKSKIVKKTFVVPGPREEVGKHPNQIAGEIISSLNRNSFEIAERGETVTFEGTMVPSRGQASFLSFCTAVSLACVALVLSITVPDVGDNWYYLTILSPLAGFYYWTRASRKEQIKVKMVLADDESSTDVIIQGDDEQIDRLRRELGLMEKGMVYVKGILER